LEDPSNLLARWQQPRYDEARKTIHYGGGQSVNQFSLMREKGLIEVTPSIEDYCKG
jgi:hypothetical protein